MEGYLNTESSLVNSELLISLAEQLKLPLVQISSIAEVFIHDNSHADINEISEISKASLNMIEGYLMSVRLQQESSIKFEPVAIGSVMYDVSQQIRRYAKIYNCEVDIDVDKKCGLVMSSRKIFLNSMVNLSYGLISATTNSRIRLVVTSKGDSIVAGVFSKIPGLNKAMLENAKLLKTESRNPLHKVSSGMVGGVFVADSLMSLVGSGVIVSRNKNESGLAVNLVQSNQLSLV